VGPWVGLVSVEKTGLPYVRCKQIKSSVYIRVFFSANGTYTGIRHGRFNGTPPEECQQYTGIGYNCFTAIPPNFTSLVFLGKG